MPVPNNFSPAEHLQDLIRKTVNREVKEYFRDVGDDNWSPDITTPRSSLRVGCTHEENDTMDMTVLRTLLFYAVIKGLTGTAGDFYSIPTDSYQQSVKFLPQVTLYFCEDLQDVEQGYNPIDAQISFRLVGETSESMTEAKARNLANKIRTEFATSNGYRFQKGRYKVSYKDNARGYNMILATVSEAEARQVINKVLDLQGHTLDAEYLTVSSLGQTPPVVPPTKFIYGKSRRLPRHRPVGYVRFRHATLHIWGIPSPITLVDLTRRRRAALITV